MKDTEKEENTILQLDDIKEFLEERLDIIDEKLLSNEAKIESDIFMKRTILTILIIFITISCSFIPFIGIVNVLPSIILSSIICCHKIHKCNKTIKKRNDIELKLKSDRKKIATKIEEINHTYSKYQRDNLYQKMIKNIPRKYLITSKNKSRVRRLDIKK